MSLSRFPTKNSLWKMITTLITQTLQKIGKYKKEVDVLHENINRLTELLNAPVLKSLRLRNINRQLIDVIIQCDGEKSFPMM